MFKRSILAVLPVILMGVSAPAGCEDIQIPTETEPSAVGIYCGDVAVLPADTFATSAVMVGTIQTEPDVYEVYAAPLPWEQIGSEVYVACPEENQIDANIHSVVVYYSPTF